MRVRRTRKAIEERLSARLEASVKLNPTPGRSLVADLPHSMSEDEYNAAMDALAAGTITPEQDAALDRDAQTEADHWEDYNLRRWGHRRGPRGAPE